MTNHFSKTYIAASDIPAHSLVKFGADDRTVTLAASSTDDVIGVSDNINVTKGNTVDVAHFGVEKVKLGGTIARGKAFTSNTDGTAILAESGNAAGFVLASGVKGDIVLAVINKMILPAVTVTPTQATEPQS